MELEVNTSLDQGDQFFHKINSQPGMFLKSFSKEMGVISCDFIEADLPSHSGLCLVLQGTALTALLTRLW